MSDLVRNLKNRNIQRMNFSFAGCGFLGIYHIGVSSCLRQHAPHLIESCQFAGASAGAIVSCCLISGCSLGDCTKFTLRLATKARSFSIGPLHPSFKITKILRDALREVLPENAHEIATGRLFISLTRVSDRENVVVSEYSSKEELIQALMCSAHVPLYSGLVPPLFRGVRYVDGGLSNNIPALNDQTISISPFAGESDICPTDRTANTLHIYLANTSMQCSMDNLYRMSRALFPPHPEILSDMCQQGFDDTLKYLQNNKLLSCVRHLSIRSVITQVPIVETDYEEEDKTDSCDEHSCYDCKKKKQVALIDKLPSAVGLVFQDAMDEMNKGVKGYIHRHKSLKLLSFLATPWFLPVDISYTYARRFLEYLPRLPRDVQVMYRETADLLRYLLTNIRHHRRRYTARFSCQLAITEVNYNQIDSDIYPTSHHTVHTYTVPQLPQNVRNLNFEFAMDLDSDLRNMRESHATRHQHVENFHLRNAHRRRSDSANGRLVSTERVKKLPRLQTDHMEVFDSLEQCLHVTNQMESIMAYHYWDENDIESCRFEEIYTFKEGDIDISKLLNNDSEVDILLDPKARTRSHSLGHRTNISKCTLEDDLEEFAEHRLEVAMKDKDFKEHIEPS